DGEELLVGGPRHRVKPSTAAAGQNDAFHRPTLTRPDARPTRANRPSRRAAARSPYGHTPARFHGGASQGPSRRLAGPSHQESLPAEQEGGDVAGGGARGPLD